LFSFESQFRVHFEAGEKRSRDFLYSKRLFLYDQDMAAKNPPPQLRKDQNEDEKT